VKRRKTGGLGGDGGKNEGWGKTSRNRREGRNPNYKPGKKNTCE